MASERDFLTEFLELYRDLPCLWDLGSEDYKDKHKKTQAWVWLTEKLQLVEPEADISQTKKKIEHMRTAYKREFKKVQDSKCTSSVANKVHVPNLWYYNLLTFLDVKSEQCTGRVNNTLEVEIDEASQNRQLSMAEETQFTGKRIMDQKKQRLIDTAQELLEQENKTTNSFVVYAGEQLEVMDIFQRQVAEKLIAEVLFLGKTGNLNYDSKIVTPSRPNLSYSSSCTNVHTSSSSSSLKDIQSSSFLYNQLVSSPQSILPTTTPQFIPPTASPQTTTRPT